MCMMISSITWRFSDKNSNFRQIFSDMSSNCQLYFFLSVLKMARVGHNQWPFPFLFIWSIFHLKCSGNGSFLLKRCGFYFIGVLYARNATLTFYTMNAIVLSPSWCMNARVCVCVCRLKFFVEGIKTTEEIKGKKAFMCRCQFISEHWPLFFSGEILF